MKGEHESRALAQATTHATALVDKAIGPRVWLAATLHELPHLWPLWLMLLAAVALSVLTTGASRWARRRHWR